MMSIVPEEEFPVDNPDDTSEIEPEEEKEETLGQTIGGGLAGLSVVFCAMEMVPGWGFIGLDWPANTFYIIAGVCGAISGFLFAHESRIAGFAGGLAGEVGALFAIQFLLQHVNRANTLILVVVGIIGALPGFGIYWLLSTIQKSISGTDETQTDVFGDAN